MSLYSDPSLSYIGSIEPTNVNGANLFEIIFDSSLTTPFMFEYIIQSDGVLATPGTIIAQDFIYPEAAQTTGIANQWILPIPFTGAYSSLSYDPSQNIMIRVYPENVGPTPWSNALALYNPPKQPTGVTASYPTQAGQIVLSVGIDMSYSDPSPPIQYLAAYYYYSVAAGGTQWAVTSPVTPTADYVNNVWVAQYTGPEITDISGNFYVSISGVFPIPGTSPQAYTVSMISSTVVATTAQPGPPLNVDISYNVYTQPNKVSSGPQTMTVNWSNPTGVPTSFTVTNYVVDISANGVGLASYSVAAGLNTFTTPAGLLDPYLTANNEIEITVSSIIGGFKYTSTPVNNKNIFVFCPAPVIDSVVSLIQSPTTQDFSFNIITPADFGVNDASGDLHWVIYHDFTANYPSSGAVIDASGTITSPVLSTTYPINVSNVPYAGGNLYGIASWINTEDTNSANILQGLYGQGFAVAYTLNDISYNVYNAAFPTVPGPQTMDLTWSAPISPPDSYSVYVIINGGSASLEASGLSAQNYTYTVPGGLLTSNNTISFYVVAIYSGVPYPSNTQSKNVFVYADAPAVDVNWATLVPNSTSPTGIDTQFTVQLQNLPLSLGVNNGVVSLTWAVYHDYNVVVPSTPIIDVSGTVLYSDISGGNVYSIFTQCAYNSGDNYGVIAWLNTQDTNSSALLIGEVANHADPIFNEPFIYDVEYNSTTDVLTGYIESNQPLTRTKNEIHYIGEGAAVLVLPYNIANLVSLGSSAVTIDDYTGVVTTVTVLRVGNSSTTAWLYTITLSNLATLPADLDYWVLNANNGTNGTYNSSKSPPYNPYPPP